MEQKLKSFLTEYILHKGEGGISIYQHIIIGGLLEKQWAENPRWAGIERAYTAEEVVKLQGSVVIEQTLATKGVETALEIITRRTVY
ncbi:hypothetical protein LSPH24S_07856 [Lysinibacillus sphaericus]